MDKINKAVEAAETYTITYHTFDQDLVDPLRFVLTEVYKNDEDVVAHQTSPASVAYLEAQAWLFNRF